MNAIIPKCSIQIRVATVNDLPFLDALQKKHMKQLGFFPRAQMEGYLKNEWMLIAEENGRAVGYVASRDRYLKRDELGVIYQLCVAPTLQRKLIGAALVKAVFERSAYGCRLYCCWCAQDLDANHFWESLGFLPVAFRAGSSGKKRAHIFWQKRIRERDCVTPWWFPSQTTNGSIREDRLVLPIPPGTHWSDAKPVILLGSETTKRIKGPQGIHQRARAKVPMNKSGKIGFGFLGFTSESKPKAENPPREKRVKQKNDPKFVAAARELRDRWLEKVNREGIALETQGKYDVSRQLPDPEAASRQAPLLTAA